MEREMGVFDSERRRRSSGSGEMWFKNREVKHIKCWCNGSKHVNDLISAQQG